MKVYNYTASDMNRLVDIAFTEAFSFGNYPPVNLINTEDGGYIIQVALAGHKKEHIHLSVANDCLYLNVDKMDPPEGKVIRRDIAGRSIRTSYNIVGLEVDKVSFEDGLLTVVLKVPEERKPRELTIE